MITIDRIMSTIDEAELAQKMLESPSDRQPHRMYFYLIKALIYALIYIGRGVRGKNQ